MTRSEGDCTPDVGKEAGTKGREVSLVMLQITVVVVPGRSTAES